jgi:hypothetical protein
MRKRRGVIYFALVLFISQVLQLAASHKSSFNSVFRNSSDKETNSTKELAFENPMMSLPLLFNLSNHTK